MAGLRSPKRLIPFRKGCHTGISPFVATEARPPISILYTSECRVKTGPSRTHDRFGARLGQLPRDPHHLIAKGLAAAACGSEISRRFRICRLPSTGVHGKNRDR